LQPNNIQGMRGIKTRFLGGSFILKGDGYSFPLGLMSTIIIATFGYYTHRFFVA